MQDGCRRTALSSFQNYDPGGGRDEIKAAAIEAGAEVPKVSEYLMTVVDELKATTCTLEVDTLIIRVSAELVQILNTISTAASSVDAKALAAHASE